MGDVKGFLKIKRYQAQYRPACERVKDYKDVATLRPFESSQEQAARCMDCGTPFCHWSCPVGNLIPEWNDLAYNKKWEKAYIALSSTNNLPEITGRLCPALCEYSCVLGINDDPVTCRENELAIIEYAFKNGFVKPKPPKARTGKKVAVIGSGPAGLTVADQLNKAGHKVTVFERYKKSGGILRYGIPDFKLEKSIIDRRLKIYEAEGIEFRNSVDVLNTSVIEKISKEYDAICITIGSRVPRDMSTQGRSLKGIHFAMDYLCQQNRIVSGEGVSGEIIDAKGKNVVVIGGGDTGSDCVGSANRQGAKCVVQIEIMPKPGEARPAEHPWPGYPVILKTTSSHEEGSERKWSIQTKKFIGENGVVKKILASKLEFVKENGKTVMREIENSDFEIDAGLVILALGFLNPEKEGMVSSFKLELDQRGNIKVNDNFETSQKGVFAAGDARRGQSLIVWAVSEGRKAAYCIDKYLMWKSSLPQS